MRIDWSKVFDYLFVLKRVNKIVPRVVLRQPSVEFGLVSRLKLNCSCVIATIEVKDWQGVKL